MSEKGISRRQFVAGAAATAAAAAVPVMTNAATAVAAPSPTAVTPLTKGDASWVPLDPKALARQAYETYKGMYAQQSACCEASWWPIIAELASREDAATPNFAKIPKGVFNFGGGGINSWRSICGCTNAGANVLKLVTNDGKAIDEYLAWYEKSYLPTNACYIDYRTLAWTPGAGKNAVLAAGKTATWGGTGCPIPYNNAPKSKANSILCHASLTNWRNVAKTWEAAKPAAQSDRCGKLCYDAVYKLAEMINTWMAGGSFGGALNSSVSSCGEGTGVACHGSSSNPATGGILQGNPMAQGKMQCTPCHVQRVGDNHGL